MRLTALSPSGRAPLSSQHSFRYLAETFSLCLPFSKTCFMLLALQPSRCNLRTAPLLSLSFSLSLSLCPHISQTCFLAFPFSAPPPPQPVSHILLSSTLISPYYSSSELKILHHLCCVPEICVYERERERGGGCWWGAFPSQ